MIPLIRLATPQEVEEVRPFSDLTQSSQVWTWPNTQGEPDRAVIRQATEVDPMLFGKGTTNQRKVMFGWGLFCMLASNGVREIYFNVDSTGQEQWQKVLENMGAQKTTDKPQFRYKLNLP